MIPTNAKTVSWSSLIPGYEDQIKPGHEYRLHRNGKQVSIFAHPSFFDADQIILTNNEIADEYMKQAIFK